MEANHQTQSVIARLMGLDELSPHQSSHKQRRVLSENYLQKTAFIGLREKSSFYTSRSSRANMEKQQGTMNVFEAKTSKVDKQSLPALDDFMKLKDQQFHSLKELGDMLDYPHFNEKIFPKYPQQPNQWQPPNDVQSLGPHLASGPFSGQMSTRNVLRWLQKLENDSLASPFEELVLRHSKRLRFHFESQNKLPHTSTKIVVLKPTFGKVKNTGRDAYLPSAPSMLNSGCTSYIESLESKDEELDNVGTEKEKTCDAESLRQCFMGPRGTAKKTVQETRRTNGNDPRVAARSIVTAEDSSLNGSDILMHSSSRSSGNKNQNLTLCSSSNGSFLSTEAKKQIFERWKTTKDFQEVEVARRSCTLGEMLAMPDGKTRRKNSSTKLDKRQSRCSVFLPSSGSNSGSPLGISSRDGWKDECNRSSLKLQASCNSYVSSESPKHRTRNEAFHKAWSSELQAADVKKDNQSTNQKPSHRDILELRKMRVTCEKVQSSPREDLEISRRMGETSLLHQFSSCDDHSADSEYNHSLQVAQAFQDDIATSEKHDVSRYGRHCSVCADTKAEKAEAFSRIFEQQPEPVPCNVSGKYGQADSHVSKASIQESSDGFPKERLKSPECDSISPEFPTKLRETNQPSPNSVLDPLFEEEKLSISECLNDICTTDFRGLAMQLELLKSKSEKTSMDGSEMAVSSDEEIEKRPLIDLPQGNKKFVSLLSVEESRDFSYLVDVLDEANFYGMNLEIHFDSRQSLECPVSPSVFEELEKKYGKQTWWKKSERRLLFDRINLGLSEILNSCTDFHILAKSVRRRLHATLRRGEVEEELWSLLAREGKEGSKDLSEKALETETKWLGSSEDIGIIYREIEEFLFKELLEELGSNVDSS